VVDEESRVIETHTTLSYNALSAYLECKGSFYEKNIPENWFVFSHFPGSFSDIKLGLKIPGNVLLFRDSDIFHDNRLGVAKEITYGTEPSDKNAILIHKGNQYDQQLGRLKRGSEIKTIVDEEVRRLRNLGRKLDSEEKKITITLTAYIRLEYSGTVSVPANFTQADMDKVAQEARERVSRGAYGQIDDSWEKCDPKAE